MTQTEVGDDLGMRMETVSRAFIKLSGRGLIETHSETILIVDLAGLKVVAGRA